MSNSHNAWKEKEAYLEAARRIQVEELQGLEAYYAAADRSCASGTPQGQAGMAVTGRTPVFTTVFSDGYKIKS